MNTIAAPSVEVSVPPARHPNAFNTKNGDALTFSCIQQAATPGSIPHQLYTAAIQKTHRAKCGALNSHLPTIAQGLPPVSKRCKADMNLAIDAGLSTIVTTRISHKFTHGSGSSNQIARHFMDHFPTKSGTSFPMTPGLLWAAQFLGCALKASRTPTSSLATPSPQGEALAQKINASTEARTSILSLMFNALAIDGHDYKGYATYLHCNWASNSSLPLGGFHAMALISDLKALEPLFSIQAVMNGQGRVIKAFLPLTLHGKTKLVSLFSLKRKGGSADPYCDQAQLTLNMCGMRKLVQAHPHLFATLTV